MLAQDSLLPDPRLYSAGLQYFSYLPDEDFLVWRSQFQAVVNRYQWTDAVVKQFAFTHMKDVATQEVLDIPLHGSETVEQILDGYQEQFCMGDNIQPPRVRRRTSKIRAFTEDAEGRRTTAAADDSAPASSPGLHGPLANLDLAPLSEASADWLNEECQRPNLKKDQWDFLVGQ